MEHFIYGAIILCLVGAIIHLHLRVDDIVKTENSNVEKREKKFNLIYDRITEIENRMDGMNT